MRVHEPGRAVIVRTTDSAGITREPTRKRSRRSLSTFIGYTKASKTPSSLPKNAAPGPVASTNSQVRAGLDISRSDAVSSCDWRQSITRIDRQTSLKTDMQQKV